MGRKKKSRQIELLGAVLGRERSFKAVVTEPPSPVPLRYWEAAVGTKIAERARPTRLERGVLTVTAATAAWSNELSMLAAPIVEKLRGFGIDVRELRFRVGALDPTPRLARRPPKVAPSPAPLGRDLQRSLADVPDDDLRDAIERAARRALGFDDPK